MNGQVLSVQWEQDDKVLICLESGGEEYIAELEIDGGLDEDEVMIAVFVYMDTHGIEMDEDCEIIFDGIVWEVV